MHNVLIDDNALIVATAATLQLNYAEHEVTDELFAFALAETKEVVKSYLEACSIRVVSTNQNKPRSFKKGL